MIRLSWRYNKARVWLDELPNWEIGEAQMFEHRQEMPHKEYTRICSAAIELLLLTGGRAYYGALGAEFIPSSEKQLVIQVPISLEEGQIIHDSLAGRLDTVRSGLPREYLRGVLDIVTNTSEMQSFGSGTIRFCRAAYGSLGSSVKLFNVLSVLVIKLLLLDKHSVAEEDLIELIQTELNNQGIKRPSTRDGSR